MNLSSDLVSKFVSVMQENSNRNTSTAPVYGTIVEYGDSKYVKLDGSDLLTPIVSAVDSKDGERVLVNIVKHSATVIGNVSSPAARSDRVEEVADSVAEVGVLVADKADIKDLQAQTGRIDNLVAENVTIREKITASEGEITNLKTDNVTVKEKLTANEAEIKQLKTDKLDASTAQITYATITNLDATNAQINNLSATYGKFVNLTTEKFEAKDAEIESLQAEDATIKGRLDANEADINTLNVNKASIDDLNAATARIGELEAGKITTDELIAKKADIDLANVNNAWIQNGIIKDGSIGEAAIHDGAITNAKIADATIEAAKIKSINADTITAGTIKTDRLIITGPDGQDSIVKAINIANGVSEADVNSQKIQAASIDVVDLSAFEAKIAGFDMSGNAIYSGKTSIKDPNSGIYISTVGIGMGDGSLTGKNEAPLQAYADGSFKLVGKNSSFDFNTVTGELNIEASSLKISSKSVATKEEVNELKDEITTIMSMQSSRGYAFKNNNISSVLSITIYHGKQEITDSTTMKEVYGNSAYLQWKWQRIDEDEYGVISVTDSRIKDDGFTFILSPDDFREKIDFKCELITD